MRLPEKGVPSEPVAEPVYADRNDAQEPGSAAVQEVTTSPDILADGQETALADAIWIGLGFS